MSSKPKSKSTTHSTAIPSVHEASPKVTKSQTEQKKGAETFTSPLYEELLELQDGENEDIDNGQYSIEVRIDYSKGTKYKVERRKRFHNKSDKNNNHDEDENSSQPQMKNNNLDSSVRSERLKQFRREKKNSFCDRLLGSNDDRSSSDAVSEGKSKFWSSLCCCG